MKRIISLALSLLLLIAFVPTVSAEDGITVLVDGNEVIFDAAPFIESGRTMVPVRAISEAMGARVFWSESTREVAIILGETALSLMIGDTELKKETGSTLTEISLDAPARIVKDRTFIPLRAVSEAFGCTVNWEDESRTITITSPDKSESSYVKSFMKELPQNENYVISPLSLKLAMLMAASGAEGETKEEILSAFQITPGSDYESGVSALMKELNQREFGEINISNSIWFNKDYYPRYPDADFSDEYKAIIQAAFGGTAETVSRQNSIEAVNAWVSEQTKGKIPHLLPESNRDYLSVLVNTIYMKSSWAEPFEKFATSKETFTDCDGKEHSIDFMHQTNHYMYYDHDGVRAVCLPYTNGLSMYVVLGEAEKIDIASITGRSTRAKVRLSLPKFKIEYSLWLRDILMNMGITRAFLSGNHEFDSMMQNVPEPALIDDVLQKAVIEVDEEGTEAAAATAVIIKAGSVAITEPEPIIDFNANEPFTYFITDNRSGEVLFAGRYVKPEE